MANPSQWEEGGNGFHLGQRQTHTNSHKCKRSGLKLWDRRTNCLESEITAGIYLNMFPV